MILAGSEIAIQVLDGAIRLEPFDAALINPNSYNYRLGDELVAKSELGSSETMTIPESGVVLYPGKVYLASTYELIGSSRFAILLIGRSSIGRLGLHLQVDADLGHRGSAHRWTLELVARKPVRVYPRMIIGQVTFWSSGLPVDLPLSDYARLHRPANSFVEHGHLP